MNQPDTVAPFEETLENEGLELRRSAPRILQVNLGRLCDLACRHCHLEAGPRRTEVMSAETMEQVLALARRTLPEVVDVTGGAPELVPGLAGFLEGLSEAAEKVMLRTNLTALDAPQRDRLLQLCVARRIVLVASFPALSGSQADALRGAGVHQRSLSMLQRLNELGYGRPGSGLELDLVANPAGAFLPPSQEAQERRFKQDLARRWGIVFNQLFLFANMPLGRFRRWLEESGNYRPYLQRLAAHFNAATLPGLMCRTLVSVAWDGFLYDCDFNLAAGLPLGGRKTHVTQISDLPAEGTPIATGEHCYGCTAGSGFT